MFHHLFINTRSSIEHIHKELRLLARVISISTQVLFISYYVYLIVINANKVGFLVTYVSLLALSLIALGIEIYFILKKGNSRLEKRLSIERKRKLNNVLFIIRFLLKVAVIVLSGVELVKYPASEMQIITFTLSIVLLVIYLFFNSLIYIINKEIDYIRLSVENDISKSKILSTLLKTDKREYTEQEQEILKEIEERSNKYLDKK